MSSFRVPARSKLDRHGLMPAVLSLLAVAAVLGLVLFGQALFGLDRTSIEVFLSEMRGSPGAFVAVVVLFSVLALTGFPQAVLFAGTVAVFGPVLGVLYAWGSTMISSGLTFGLGRIAGARWTARLQAGTLQDLTIVMQRRGVLASMVVRWTPSAPFIVVNAVCGASGMALWRFLLGTGIGIVPKLLIIAFFTEQVEAAATFITSGDPKALGLLVVAALTWAAFIMFCRRLYKKMGRGPLAALTRPASEELPTKTTQAAPIKAKSSAV